MHGINAPRQYSDVLGQFSAMGYAVLDIEYGWDSERSAYVREKIFEAVIKNDFRFLQ